MSHASGWIDLYGALEEGRTPPADLVAQCRDNKNGLGETIVHWYAIEGTAEVLAKLIELGFDADTADDSGTTPIISAAMIARWDNVSVLRAAGVAIHPVDSCGYSYRSLVTNAGPAAPLELQLDAFRLDDLLLPNGPEATAVLTLRLTRDGVPAEVEGAPLTEESFHAFYAGLIDEPTTTEDELGLASFEVSDDLGPHIEVLSGELEERRRAHAIAQHFGLRVLWDFCCPEN